MSKKFDFIKRLGLDVDLNKSKKRVTIEKFKFRKFNFRKDEEFLKGEIDLNDIQVTNDNLLQYSGKLISIYLHEQYYDLEEIIKNPDKGKKYHITECKTIRDNKEEHKKSYERYLLSNSFNGIYKIGKNGKVVDTKLKVCRNCLRSLNYKNYNFLRKTEKDKIYNEFSLEEFFLNYTSTVEHFPIRTVLFENDYDKDWMKISRKYRESKNYICEKCKTSFKEHRHLLHTHHINRNKSDNYKNNLQALCLDCHRREPEHKMIISREELCKIYDLRREQGIIKKYKVSDIYVYADISLHDLLQALEKNKKYNNAIAIGKSMKYNQNIIYFDLYWDDKKEAISKDIYEITLIDKWKIYSPKEFMNKLFSQ